MRVDGENNKVVSLKLHRIEKQYKEYYSNPPDLSLDRIYNKQRILEIRKKKFTLMA